MNKNTTQPFVPSPWRLLKMIEVAEAKFDAQRKEKGTG